jgi:hypothetical protein
MRKDEHGDPCPETLGEYLTFCEALMPDSRASIFLRRKISSQGEQQRVVVSDLMMRTLLLPMILSSIQTDILSGYRSRKGK